MPQGTTKLAQLINPEVMADMISANLPRRLNSQTFWRSTRNLKDNLVIL